MNADSLRSGDEHLKRASKAQLLALTNAIEWQSGIGRGDPQSIHHLGMAILCFARALGIDPESTGIAQEVAPLLLSPEKR